jgi:hypothetical protein
MWVVRIVPEFEPELAVLKSDVRDELLAQARVIEMFGPQARRPRVDTLKGSKYANMKELRIDADGGVWRAAFVFDPSREAIVLVAGDNSGQSEAAFYRALIAKADARFDAHLERIRAQRAEEAKARRAENAKTGKRWK